MVERVRAALEPRRDPERAVVMAAYMKNQFAFLGIPNPERVAVLKPLWKPWQPDSDELLEVAAALWHLPEREYQYAALGALCRHWKRLDSSALETIGRLVTVEKPWWDTVDVVASRLAGELVRRDAGLLVLMDAFASDDNLWLRRIAVLHQLRYHDETNEERLFRYALINAAHESFWIRKALGWALREYAKHNPTAVQHLVKSNRDTFSKLTRREALKHLS